MATDPKMLIIFTILLGIVTPFTTSQKTGPAETIKEYVDAHNVHRQAVGTPPLKWDDKLASYATNYAQKQAAKNCEFEHSYGPYGENLQLGMGDEWTAKGVVDYWATEKKDFDVKTNQCLNGEECGHYTQIVSRQSKTVGCGAAKCPNGQTFIICSYEPVGNIDGQNPITG